MAINGPAPKDPRQRMGHSMGQADSRAGIDTLAAGRQLPPPKPDKDWHPYAIGWYNSLKLSGQSQSYEASDWMLAIVAADLLSEMFYMGWGEKGVASLLGQWQEMSVRLCTSLGDRRRARIELIKSGKVDSDDDAAAADMNAWRRKLRSPDAAKS